MNNYTITVKDLDTSFTALSTEDNKIKKLILDSLAVFEEGYQFSPRFKAGVWDGKKHFAKILDRNTLIFPKGLTEGILKKLSQLNYNFTYDEISFDLSVNEEDFNSFIQTLGLPFEPYDYQISSALDILNNHRGIWSSATGSGKSLIIYLVTRYLLSLNKRILVVVPTISLTTQLKNDFKDYSPNDSSIVDQITLIGGENNIKDLSSKPIVISTWQSLQYMKKEEFEIFDSIIIDEAHLATSDSLDNILKNACNANIKIGMTGSVPKSPIDRLTLMSTLGPVYKVITPQQLIDKGLATPIFINNVYLDYNKEDKKYLNKGRPNYIKEEEFILTHKPRNWTVSKLLEKVSNKGNTLALFSKIEHGKLLLKNAIQIRTGNSDFYLLDKVTPKQVETLLENYIQRPKIVYINNPLSEKEIKSIKTLFKKKIDYPVDKFLQDIVPLSSLNLYMIYGATSGADREQIRHTLETIHIKDFKVQLTNEIVICTEGDMKKYNIKEGSTYKEQTVLGIEQQPGSIIFGSWAIVSTGVNYKNLRNIVYASSLKSFTKVLQSIGRAMRLHKNKTASYIFDIIDCIEGPRGKENYALKHSAERNSIYMEYGFPIKEFSIKLP